MNYVWLIPYYVAWHYTRGIKDLLLLWKNFLWFVGSFFSIRVLVRTFFAPFEGLNYKYKGNFDPKDFFSTLIVNILMRLYGMVARTFVIVAGAIAYVAMLISGFTFVILWVVAPLVAVFFLALGILAFLGIA